MKTGSIRRIFATVLVLAMLAACATVAHATEVETVIYSEDFNSVSSATRTAWKTAYAAANATPGQWYLYSGDVYTHNLAIGKAGTASESRMPIPFGTTLDIVNNKYELTFKLNHIQYMDTVWIACVATNAAYGLFPSGDEDKVSAMGSNTYDVKIVIENQAWTVYRKTVGASEYTSLGGRTVAGATLDGVVFRVMKDTSELIHAIDDICVKQVDKTTGDVIATVYEENFNDWTMASKGTGKSIDEICATAFYSQYQTIFNGYLVQPYLIPLSGGSNDGCLGYLQKSSHRTHGDSVDNYMRFVFPEAMTEGKYKIIFDYSPSKEWCSWIYVQGKENGTTVKSAFNINAAWQATGFSTHNMIIDMDNKTYQLDNGNVTSFDLDNIDRILFRQHLDAGASRSTMIDNFSISRISEAPSVLTSNTLSVTSYAFKDGSDNTLSAVPTSGTVKADVTLGINTPGNYTFSAIIATYAADDSFLNVVFQPVTVTESEISKNVSLQIGATDATRACKVFFWNMENGSLMPLTGVISFPAE